jgi:uncharacterized protein YciI
VEPSGLESSYDDFVLTLRSRRFLVPDHGWTAELIGAHVAANNDLIADLAERVARGDQPTYDNADEIDDVALAAYVARVGDANAVASEIERSAQRLARARDSLGSEGLEYQLPAIIRDGDTIAHDGPLPLGAFIAGNADFHLERHVEQLRALILENEADPPEDFDEYELVLLLRGKNPPDLDDEASELLQRRHLGYLEEMRAMGYLKVAGPLDEQPDERWRGISLYQVGSLDEVERLAHEDPAVKAGRLDIEVMKWYCAKGAVAFPLNRGD